MTGVPLRAGGPYVAITLTVTEPGLVQLDPYPLRERELEFVAAGARDSTIAPTRAPTMRRARFAAAPSAGTRDGHARRLSRPLALAATPGHGEQRRQAADHDHERDRHRSARAARR